MKKELVSIAFVAVYKQTQAMIPVFDNRFCRSLFGMPIETENGMTPDGYAIFINNKPIPLVIVNPQKIIFKAKDVDELLHYVEKVKEELASKNFVSEFSAYGINYEYQLFELGQNSDSWICEKFIKTDSLGEKEMRCNSVSLRLPVEEDESEAINLSIEPRAGMRDGVFVAINHHHQTELNELPQGNELRKMFEQSYSLMENKIINRL